MQQKNRTNVCFPNYENCIANLACSILKYYYIQPPNPTLPQADVLLQKQYKNVVVLLLDGMGTDIVQKHLKEDGFLRKHMKCTYSSTFPPTTVAATTAMDSGLFPNQSAWLGWTGYFEEIDRNVLYFLNEDSDTGEKIEELNVGSTFVPYENVRSRIKSTGVQAHYLASFVKPFPKSYSEICDGIRQLCDSEGRKYIYAYWPEPDASMHEYGVDDERIGAMLTEIEACTKQLASRLLDTLLLITADHGMINIENEALIEYPDIYECLLRMPSMEPRALNFFIKDGKKTQFEEAFLKHFGESFLLFTKEEVLEKQLLGTGKNHERLMRMLGDYLAVATGSLALGGRESGEFKGHHAGLLPAEMQIPLIAVER